MVWLSKYKLKFRNNYNACLATHYLSDCKTLTSKYFLPQAEPKKPLWAICTVWDMDLPVWLHRVATTSQDKRSCDENMKLLSTQSSNSPGFFAARPLNHFHCLSSISPRPFHLLYMFNPAKRSLWQMAAASWKWLTSTCPSVWCSQRSSVLLPAYTKYAKFRTFAISTLI